jgi:hypothetical protein
MRSMMASINFRHWALSAWMTPIMSSLADCDTCSTLKYAHHQNGKAENRIRDVTTGARTSLLHAAHRWPKALNAYLWPVALKNYTNLRNAMPTQFTATPKQVRKQLLDRYDGLPVSRFSGTSVEANLNHFHPFGSPVYMLEGKLEAQKAFNKWNYPSKVGIFLCHSPSHASNVPLILNTQTGNVLPQFHCIYDNEFHTCQHDANCPDVTMSMQQCARFCNNPKRKHEEAVKRVWRYLMKTKDRGLNLKPDESRGLEC